MELYDGLRSVYLASFGLFHIHIPTMPYRHGTQETGLYADPAKIHNTSTTRALMAELYDPQFANVTDIDCFSQAFFRSLDDYKRMKQDPWYKEKLMGDHENFADTKRSM